MFEWHHACGHARRLLGINAFPVAHEPGIVGTLADARDQVLSALASIDGP